jgi:uncharacterized membrane protein YfcA
MLQFIWLIPLGYAVGAFGTLIGAGGGFILVPVLLLLYPDKSPETITSVSLAVVFFNAVSGSFAYARMKKIDYKSGLIFAAATIPGSILGAMTTSYIPRRIFDGVFGSLILILSIYLFFKKENTDRDGRKSLRYKLFRVIKDVEGNTYEFSYNPITGIIISLFVGYLSSLLGIGGGIIHVPALVHMLNFPVHLATATSHFILAIAAFTGSAMHAMRGELSPGLLQIAGLSVGVIFGAQLGAKLSKKVHGNLIIRALAVALGLVAARILIMAFFK